MPAGAQAAAGLRAPPHAEAAAAAADPALQAADLTLQPDDHALIAAAHDVLARHYKPFWHTVAAAVRSHDGRIWTGLHIGATVGRLSICAEAVAFGRALLEGDGSIATAVAVRHPKPDELDRELAVVPPCGACREMILDHWPDARIILQLDRTLLTRPIRALLPAPYRR
jgi:cytidine deaminase